MNRILSFGLAAMVTTFLAQPVYADKGGKGGGSGGRSGGSKVSAPTYASVAHAPAFHAYSMHAPSAPHMAFYKPAPTVYAPSLPRTTFSKFAPIVRSSPRTTFTPLVARGRSFVQPQGNAPSIAFGGHGLNNNAVVNAQNARNFATTDPSTQSTVRGDPRSFRPPTEMSRNWDRGRTHEWRHHHFRFFGGDWVIIDPGIPYDYGYPYGYYGDEPVPYSSPAYSYDYSSDSLVASVQDQLDRLGYSAGPVDGEMGPQTRDAIADFQNDRGLPVTGQIDRPLLRALGL